MEDGEPRNTENFEERKISKFQWGLWDVSRCSPFQPSLKEASKYQAIHGIILSLVFFVFGVGWYLIIPDLRSASYFGLPSLLAGTLLLIYSLLLLSSVCNNQGFRAPRVIKVGCLILLYLELIIYLMIFVGTVILLADSFRYRMPVGGVIELLVDLLGLFLTGLGIYAIHSDKPKIVSLYIYIITILFMIMTTLFVIGVAFILLVASFGDQLGGFPADLRDVGVIIFQYFPLPAIILITILISVVILVGSMMDYYWKIFVLHVNMMTIAQVKNNEPQLISF